MKIKIFVLPVIPRQSIAVSNSVRVAICLGGNFSVPGKLILYVQCGRIEAHLPALADDLNERHLGGLGSVSQPVEVRPGNIDRLIQIFQGPVVHGAYIGKVVLGLARCLVLRRALAIESQNLAVRRG